MLLPFAESLTNAVFIKRCGLQCRIDNTEQCFELNERDGTATQVPTHCLCLGCKENEEHIS